ncbi:Conserved oligomeric Golgi complex subunit [Coemansia javaensis]|uniref:Conserved oligomeric Golgi complex subunit 5 n=1 Tax=Coemansia javaensis TaxID=2761396 RepID=A0A9W8HH70_9FUNG|nr:Conserved oligomeric Golgi complex subunit [Coemansia javaensis]
MDSEADGEARSFESSYAEFLAPGFDAAQYAQNAVKGESSSGQADRIAQLMAALSGRAESLDDLMQRTIVASHEDLLSQIVGIKTLDVSLGQVEEQVREIKSYMHGLRTKIRVPYEQSRVYANQSSNLHAAIQSVRGTSKFIQLVRRLRTLMPDSAVRPLGDGQSPGDAQPDFALAALTLLDIDRLVSGSDLAGIRLVDEAMERVVSRRRELTVGVAEELIESGMRRQHQSDISSGMQVLFNLGVLPALVAKRVRGYTVSWAAFVSGKLNPKAISACVREHNARSTAIDGSDMVGIDSVLWSRLEALVDELLARGLELRALERVLARKRDVLPRFDASGGALDGQRADWGAGAAAGVSFLDLTVSEIGDRVLAFWWGTAVNALAAEAAAACAESGVIRQILTNSYPRLVQLFLPKLEHILSPRLGGVVSVGGSATQDSPLHRQAAQRQSPNVSYSDPGLRVLWDQLLARFESEYVAKATSRIEEAVARCYPPAPPPGLLDAQESWSHRGAQAERASDMERMTAVSIVPNRKLVVGVVRSISTELEMAKSDPRLWSAVAGAAAGVAASFADITQGKVASITVNPSVLDPGKWPAHPLTKSYVGLVNTVEELRKRIEELWASEAATHMPQRLPESSLAAASGSNGGPKAACRDTMDGCLDRLSSFVEDHVSALFRAADTAIAGSIADGDTSSGTQAMQWLQTQVLEPLEVECQERVRAMVDRYLGLYVCALCLAYPLTEDEKLRLTGEVTQFEFACSQVLAAAGPGARSREGLALDGLGRSYQALRLMRPLLFMSAAELAAALGQSDGVWQQVPLLDLLDHAVCRIATEVRGRERLPFELLGCTQRQWIACVSVATGRGAAGETDVDICYNRSMRSAWGDGVDVRGSCSAVLCESLDKLSACIQPDTGGEGLGELADAARRALSAIDA